MSQNIVLAAGVTNAAALSHAHTTSANAAHTDKRNWPAATKSAFYANFYAVDEATGAYIG
ncbi:MAG: hypothetical protein RL428_282 [Actinomycetota bacterium]|jgi:hypothetical protein